MTILIHIYKYTQRHTNDLSLFCPDCVVSMCASATFRRCGTAVSSPACGPSPTSAVRRLCPFSARCRKFTLRLVHPLQLPPVCLGPAWTKPLVLTSTFIPCRWEKSACSAADRPDWPRTWRKLVRKWTRGIRPILNITMRTFKSSSAHGQHCYITFNLAIN